MAKDKQAKTNPFKHLEKFLGQNETLDLKTTDLLNSNHIESFNWKGLSSQKENVLKQLQAYQRLNNVLPDAERKLILDLLEAGIHSAIQIASMPKPKFIAGYGHLFGHDLIRLEQCYQHALAIRTNLLLRHMRNIQGEGHSVW